MESLLVFAAAVTLVAAAVASVAKWIVVPVMTMLRNIREFLDDWHGEPGRPGVPERLSVMSRLGRIEKELHPNGGSSLRDAVDQTRSMLEQHRNDPKAHTSGSSDHGRA